MPAQYILDTTTNGQYYFRLTAENNETILNSEHYTARQGALNGVQAVKDNSPYEFRYERRQSRDYQFYFVLKAANGEIIGTSETYTTQGAVENGISAVKRVGTTAPILDRT